ncbi:DUF177 domain-containing protein [Sulfitobacter sp. F26204]|uniref:YceD family protein n=1 Tax=Sulfitobacter sp. F26204 TaxID=2996014 RepID=UPI00225DF750|nr:DUF177 domain-containing protein [Sulfitobacter sp. F26204]MCX7559568.1 DUF177 domain-containing protein [Sulfitobacter sp. F26204]
MAHPNSSDTAIRVSDLSQSTDNAFALRPDAEELKTICSELGFLTLRKLSFDGQITPIGNSDWALEGQLGATIVQPCVVTLEPVTTRIDVAVRRQYLSGYTDPEEPEAEMPEDDSTEPLGNWIDPGQVMRESLALAAPDYPRKNDATLGQMVYTKPGESPMTDEDARPFAGLADLKNKLEKGGN